MLSWITIESFLASEKHLCLLDTLAISSEVSNHLGVHKQADIRQRIIPSGSRTRSFQFHAALTKACHDEIQRDNERLLIVALASDYSTTDLTFRNSNVY